LNLRNDTAYPQTVTDDYYLNNANDMFGAMVTLCELLVVNNWFVVAEGFVAASSVPGWMVRAFFVQFHLISTMLVLNVVIAFVIDAYEVGFRVRVRLRVTLVCSFFGLTHTRWVFQKKDHTKNRIFSTTKRIPHPNTDLIRWFKISI